MKTRLAAGISINLIPDNDRDHGNILVYSQVYVEPCQDVVYYDFTLDRELGLIFDKITRGELGKRSAVRAIKHVFSAASESSTNNEKEEPLPPLPERAPDFYRDSRIASSKNENIVEFLRRVWMPWIERGVLTRSYLRKLDPKADQAITNWRRTHPWPSDLPVPSRSDAKAVREARIASDPDAMEQLRDARRKAKQIARALGKFG